MGCNYLSLSLIPVYGTILIKLCKVPVVPLRSQVCVSRLYYQSYCWLIPLCMMFAHHRVTINTLRPRQNGRHFTDDIFKCIFFNENVWILLKISLKFVPNIWINHIPVLVQIMAWCRPGDKPLSEPMMICLLKQICVTRPQWVNSIQAWISYYIDYKVWYEIAYPFLNMSMLFQVLAFHWRLLGPPIGISALKMQIIERSTLLTVSVETRESIQTWSVLQKTFHMTCIVWVHIISSCRSHVI